jgi:hypothetical protein
MVLDRFLFRSHLQQDEKLLYVIHQHWWAMYRSGFKIAFFGMLAPALLWLMLPTLSLLYIFGAWFFLGFIRFLYEVVDWYFDAILLTSMGVVYVDWRGIFDKASHRADFESIAGVEYEQSGFLSHLFGFGMLVLDKEGAEEERIFLSHARDPQEAERQVLLAKEKYTEEHAMESEEALKEILSGLVAEHLRKEKHKSKLADLL